ncbi:OSTALPHA [Mytilus coruscus]|uniref:OSTALPHA n=1 Tax=Mytilus coruscus TaxID=42192 RepID=A0A6J8BVG2_MYTCO|nr:OSTALPHA [Mytilus coruscus]
MNFAASITNALNCLKVSVPQQYEVENCLLQILAIKPVIIVGSRYGRMSNCSNEFPTTGVLYDELSVGALVPALIGCALAFVVIGIYVEEIWFILHHYPHKTQRTKFICLLGLYPVVCITSSFAVLIPRATFLCELVAATYLSFCILLFVNMMVSYFGGTKHLLHVMSDENMPFGVPPCCCLVCFNKLPFNRKHLRIATIMVLQITIIKPVSLFIAAVLWTDNQYTPGDESAPKNGVFYTNLTSIISTVTGIWGIAIIYRSTRSKLPAYRIGIKFISLQLVLIFLNLQFGIISLLARNDIPECAGTRDSLVRGYRLHHTMLVYEAFLVSILARFAYRRLEPELISRLEFQNEVQKTDENKVNGNV